MNVYVQIYRKLMKLYGPQGWWPHVDHNGSNPTKFGAVDGYHPGDYSFPRNNKEKYEIIIGAVLTQNTSWTSVEKALLNLNKLCGLDPEKILKLDSDVVKEAIRPAGYFNQKYEYLKNVTEFFLSLDGRVPSREEVISVKGIGNETADSIMLYAFSQCEFVVDAYLKRVFLHLGLIDEKDGYMDIKKMMEKNISKDLIVYQEYHALIDEHAKRYYKTKPYGVDDPLKKILNRFS